MRNDDIFKVKKIRAHLSSLPSISQDISQEFAWDECCEWRIKDRSGELGSRPLGWGMYRHMYGQMNVCMTFGRETGEKFSRQSSSILQGLPLRGYQFDSLLKKIKAYFLLRR